MSANANITVKEKLLADSQQVAKIKRFINTLANITLTGNVFNQYSYAYSINSIRRNNLFLYFQQMVTLNPQLLVVGEASGHRGCRLTGVPFTSEFILLNGLDKIGLFGESRGYRKTNEVKTLCKEASASIFWETFLKVPSIPLIWNAFPFHPYQDSNEQSNRPPKATEIAIGKDFLQTLIHLFDIKIVVAIGNTSEATLKSMGIVCYKVRHPSYGGKIKFTNGINAVINTVLETLTPVN